VQFQLGLRARESDCGGNEEQAEANNEQNEVSHSGLITILADAALPSSEGLRSTFILNSDLFEVRLLGSARSQISN
jgi:hypothetical protein